MSLRLLWVNLSASAAAAAVMLGTLVPFHQRNDRAFDMTCINGIL